MDNWVFMVYIEPDGTSPIETWRAGLAIKDRAKVDNYLWHLRNESQIRYPLKPLRAAQGIHQLVLKIENMQHRPLGFIGPGEKEFTFLIPATKRQGRKHQTRWDPPNAIDLAIQCMNAVTNDGSRIRAYPFDPPTTH